MAWIPLKCFSQISKSLHTSPSLEAALGVDLVVEGGHGDEVPGTDDLGGGLGGAVDAVAQLVVDVGAKVVGELHAARGPGRALGHELGGARFNA